AQATAELRSAWTGEGARPHTSQSTLRLSVGPERRWPRSMPVLAQAAVAAVAFLIVFDPLEQLNAAEIRPQRLRHIDLRIGKLPEQEVTQPHLAAGANYQVRIGQTPRVEMVANRLLIDFHV